MTITIQLCKDLSSSLIYYLLFVLVYEASWVTKKLMILLMIGNILKFRKLATNGFVDMGWGNVGVEMPPPLSPGGRQFRKRVNGNGGGGGNGDSTRKVFFCLFCLDRVLLIDVLIKYLIFYYRTKMLDCLKISILPFF